MPGFPQDCAGATDEQIQRLDKLSGGRLPAFYRWFLRTMGGDLGPLESMLDGFSVQSVLQAHESQKKEMPPGLFLIAVLDDDDEELVPMALYYDLDHSVRDDALVLVGPLGDTEVDLSYETLREEIACGVAYVFGVVAAPHCCQGEFNGAEDTVSDQLEAVLGSLGFVAPVAPQRYSKVMEADGATLVCEMPPNATNKGRFFFSLGGADPGALRRILGEIADQARIEVTIDSWHQGTDAHPL